MPAMEGMPNMGNMNEMMNNPMVKEMMNNPEMMKMAQQMMMGGGMGSGGMPDPNKMQDMMKNPSMAKLLENPEFLSSTLEMLKSPAARGQVDAIAKQTGMSSDTLLKVLSFLVNCAHGASKVKSFFSNPIIYYGFLILVISYLLKWFGFTDDLLFMMPFRKQFN